MAVTATKPAPFPVGAVAANALGLLCLAAGVFGLFAPQLLDALPALKDPTTAWTFIGVGIVLDAGSAVSIVAHLRSRRVRMGP